MPTVVAAIVRRGHAFSGDATARVVGDVGGRRDGPPRPLDRRVVMIARARALSLRRSGARPSVADVAACS
jgi:hypothetical protein